MSQELIYTSAPQGLLPGSHGFCTVVATQGMPSNLMKRLEALSGYRHAYAPQSAKALLNPTCYSYLQVEVAGRRCHVLSLVCDAGLDYSQRSNKLAHHVVLDAAELPAGGPAAALGSPGLMQSRWDGKTRTLSNGRTIPQVNSAPRVCLNWQRLTGDAGWAGVLAESVAGSSPSAATLIYPPGTGVLPLIAESLALLNVDQRWGVTFSTYYTKLPVGIDCRWRCVLDGTPEAAAARTSRQQLVIDLTTDLGPAVGGALVDAARLGRVVRTTPAGAGTSSRPAIQPGIPVGELHLVKRAGSAGAASPPLSPLVSLPPPLNDDCDFSTDLPRLKRKRPKTHLILGIVGGILFTSICVIAAILAKSHSHDTTVVTKAENHSEAVGKNDVPKQSGSETAVAKEAPNQPGQNGSNKGSPAKPTQSPATSSTGQSAPAGTGGKTTPPQGKPIDKPSSTQNTGVSQTGSSAGKVTSQKPKVGDTKPSQGKPVEPQPAGAVQLTSKRGTEDPALLARTAKPEPPKIPLNIDLPDGNKKDETVLFQFSSGGTLDLIDAKNELMLEPTQNQDVTTWNCKKKGGTTLATFKVDAKGQLTFQWQPGQALVPDGQRLRYCLLLVKAKEYCALVKPVEINAVPLRDCFKQSPLSVSFSLNAPLPPDIQVSNLHVAFDVLPRPQAKDIEFVVDRDGVMNIRKNGFEITISGKVGTERSQVGPSKYQMVLRSGIALANPFLVELHKSLKMKPVQMNNANDDKFVRLNACDTKAITSQLELVAAEQNKVRQQINESEKALEAMKKADPKNLDAVKGKKAEVDRLNADVVSLEKEKGFWQFVQTLLTAKDNKIRMTVYATVRDQRVILASSPLDQHDVVKPHP